MSQRLYILLTVCTLCFGAARAQLLYEITGNGAAAPSYLLGTNRITDIRFLDTIPNVFTVYGRCNKVVTEFSFEDYEALNTLRQAALLPDSVRLHDYFTDEEYDALDHALLSTIGMGMEQLGRMKPAYLGELYRTELLTSALLYNPERSMESFFEHVAQQSDIPVFGLDNVGETMYMLFDREPFEWQCTELKRMLTHPEREVQQEEEMADMYRNGRLNDMVYLVLSPDNQSSLSYSDYQVFAQRNEQWGKRLQPYLKDGKAFITLNALYLGGEKGLIAVLRKNGYRVKKVNS